MTKGMKSQFALLYLMSSAKEERDSGLSYNDLDERKTIDFIGHMILCQPMKSIGFFLSRSSRHSPGYVQYVKSCVT